MVFPALMKSPWRILGFALSRVIPSGVTLSSSVERRKLSFRTVPFREPRSDRNMQPWFW